MTVGGRCEKTVCHAAVAFHSQPQPAIDGGLCRAAALQEKPDSLTRLGANRPCNVRRAPNDSGHRRPPLALDLDFADRGQHEVLVLERDQRHDPADVRLVQRLGGFLLVRRTAGLLAGLPRARDEFIPLVRLELFQETELRGTV